MLVRCYYSMFVVRFFESTINTILIGQCRSYTTILHEDLEAERQTVALPAP